MYGLKKGKKAIVENSVDCVMFFETVIGLGLIIFVNQVDFYQELKSKYKNHFSQGISKQSSGLEYLTQINCDPNQTRVISF